MLPTDVRFWHRVSWSVAPVRLRSFGKFLVDRVPPVSRIRLPPVRGRLWPFSAFDRDLNLIDVFCIFPDVVFVKVGFLEDFWAVVAVVHLCGRRGVCTVCRLVRAGPWVRRTGALLTARPLRSKGILG